MAVLNLLCGCGQEHKRYVPNAGDGYTTPTMSTSDVSTLISDSGYTRYHLVAPAWLMYEDAEEPFWRFPDGLELEQYDLEMQPSANVVCDSAIYFSRKRLWQLDGNVVMVNTEADSFLTQQMFWDQNSRKIYSDSFIHIVRTDRIIEGYGFESDQSMRYFTVNRPTALLPVERGTKKGSVATDSASTDTATTGRERRQSRRRPSETVAQNDNKSDAPEAMKADYSAAATTAEADTGRKQPMKRLTPQKVK